MFSIVFPSCKRYGLLMFAAICVHSPLHSLLDMSARSLRLKEFDYGMFPYSLHQFSQGLQQQLEGVPHACCLWLGFAFRGFYSMR
jgi:hypothetical protein